MIPVKICGITNLNDALNCIRYGAAALGFIFAPSKRQVTPETVARITRELSPFVTKIGVFVDEDPYVIKQLMKDCRLDLAQLHGSESPDVAEQLEGRVIKAFRAGLDQPDLIWKDSPVRAILIDTYSPDTAGGTGKTFDWRIFETFRTLKLPQILAGGLNESNIEAAIKTARPDLIDVSSGVEYSPGLKDEQKVASFMEKVKNIGA
ncbi:MAG TPA: phosphoribosylanthranilate isomerase [Bacillota bacterium]|jgi:phosphoribosylanthranilate isomerase|nr:phosphoribosylanthranilate isomerase [Bacillota bacterium]HOL09380.1 phosphoribosylanthranilate isomerase [Bacillota bacterium]HPO97071.1 phosphoribosylanthranilate isomerase [Bacillota bacterium]